MRGEGGVEWDLRVDGMGIGWENPRRILDTGFR